jgi:hypothetical protein
MGKKFENVWMCMEDGNEGCLRLEDGTGLCAEGGWQYESVYGGWEIKGVLGWRMGLD